jgi:uncharacterized membrane protein
MHWTQILFGTSLIVVLLALAGFYGLRQVHALRHVRDTQESSLDERRYLVRRAWRRLFGCGLMVLLAVMLGVLMLFLEDKANELASLSEAARARGETPHFDAEQRQFSLLYGWWIIGMLVALLAILTTAAVDMLATRSFTLGQFRRIQADRRAMIERTVARMRQERNGHQ